MVGKDRVPGTSLNIRVEVDEALPEHVAVDVRILAAWRTLPLPVLAKSGRLNAGVLFRPVVASQLWN